MLLSIKFCIKLYYATTSWLTMRKRALFLSNSTQLQEFTSLFSLFHIKFKSNIEFGPEIGSKYLTMHKASHNIGMIQYLDKTRRFQEFYSGDRYFKT